MSAVMELLISKGRVNADTSFECIVLGLADALVKRWAELTRAGIKKDVERYDSADEFDQAYLRAYWVRHNNLLIKLTRCTQKARIQTSR